MPQYEIFYNYNFPSGIWSPFLVDAPLKYYKAGSYIYLQGQQPDYFYYLVRGTVRSLIYSETGDEKVLAVYHEGSIFGEASFFDESPRMSSAHAASDCDIAVIDRAAFARQLSKSPELAMSMMKYLAGTIKMLSAQVDSMTFLQADKRIARWLLTTAGNDGVINCSHEEISSIIGGSRVTVSRVLGKFTKNEWIQTLYKRIVIKNREALTDFAEN